MIIHKQLDTHGHNILKQTDIKMDRNKGQTDISRQVQWTDRERNIIAERPTKHKQTDKYEQIDRQLHVFIHKLLDTNGQTGRKKDKKDRQTDRQKQKDRQRFDEEFPNGLTFDLWFLLFFVLLLSTAAVQRCHKKMERYNFSENYILIRF